jgi:hypothetical protein
VVANELKADNARYIIKPTDGGVIFLRAAGRGVINASTLIVHVATRILMQAA